MSAAVKKAAKFAAAAHKRQRRKYSGRPYVGHPVAVMNLLRRFEPAATEAMLVAALLHDTVEDTAVTLAEVEAAFGAEVAALVSGLTDVSRPSDGNRRVRKALDRAHTAEQSAACQLVKCADVLHNAEDIRANDPSFARLFVEECRALLDVMRAEVKTTALFQAASAALH